MTRHFARLAVSVGASYGELAETFAGCILSRGIEAYRTGDTVLRELFPDEPKGHVSGPPPAFKEDVGEILCEFEAYYGSVPLQVRRLSEQNEQALIGYYQMRTDFLRNTLLSRRLKELVYVAINAADKFGTGIRIHARGALQAGATPAELVEAIMLTVPSAGIVAWLEAHPILEELLGDQWR